MNLFLTLFFISFLGIFILLSRRILLLKKMNLQNINIEEDLSIKVPDLEEIKQTLDKSFKKYGYITLFVTIKIYLLSKNVIKKYTVKIKKKIRNKIGKNNNTENKTEIKEKEASKFIKAVRDYKDKVKRIKYKIKKETGLK